MDTLCFRKFISEIGDKIYTHKMQNKKEKKIKSFMRPLDDVWKVQ